MTWSSAPLPPSPLTTKRIFIWTPSSIPRAGQRHCGRGAVLCVDPQERGRDGRQARVALDPAALRPRDLEAPAMAAQHRSGEIAVAARSHHRVGHGQNAADIRVFRAYDGRAARHGLEDGVRKALVVRGKEANIARGRDLERVAAVADELDEGLELEPVALGHELGLVAGE